MKSQLNKIFTLIIILSFFSFSKSYSIEGVNELTDAINEAKEEFNNLSESSNEQSKIIDEAIKEIDKATEFVQEAIDNNNTEDAIKTLEFIERSLTDVESIIPQEFGSDMSNIDTSAIEKEDMDTITDITKQMNVAKEKKLNEFMSDLVDLNQKGIDTISISEKLNNLGIDTVQISLDISEGQNIETWTKEQWAESYNGSILTTDGTDVADKEISAEVVDLEQKLEANNLAIIDKRSSLAELQTQIDPLSNQITDLKTQKTNLLAKYNEEILKQSTTILSDEEINNSKELADQFNNELSNITNQISIAEQQSSSLQQQVQDLNIELTNEIADKNQLQNSIKDLNNQLSANQNILSKKTLELDQLKNTDLNIKVGDLNEKLERVTLQRDFAQRDFDKSIDKEVEAFQRYYSALGNVNADNYEIQAEYAVREVQAILNPDPKEYRAFEYEKYSKLAGFSQDFIDEGLAAIANDDWDKQKEITKQITKALEKNPQAVLPEDWYFGKLTDGDINVMIAEDRAIQEAVYTSIELDNIKEKVNSSIAEKTKDIQPLANLNSNLLQYQSFREGSIENEFFQNEYSEVVNETDLGIKMKDLTKDLSEKQNELNQLVELDQQRKDNIKSLIDPIQKSMSEDFLKMNDISSQVNEISSEINKLNSEIYSSRIEYQELEQTVIKDIYNEIKADTAKIYDTIYGNATNMDVFTSNIVKDLKFMPTKSKEWNKFSFTEQEKMWTDLKNLEKQFKSLSNDQILKNEVFKNQQIVELNNELNKLTNEQGLLINKQSLSRQQYTDISKAYAEKSSNIMNIRLENQTTTEEWGEIYNLQNQISSASMEKISIEREVNEIARQNLIESVEAAKQEYNQIIAEESKELTEYKNKISNILKEIPTFENDADLVADLDPIRLRAKLVDLAGDTNESAAVDAALKELAEIGDAPVSEYMTGPYWESSNIKTAAIVRSKKYSYVDDYEYLTAYRNDPLTLDVADREELEGDIKGVLGDSNVILDALNKKVDNLSSEVNLTKEQSQNLTSEISKLENELSSLKSSEDAILTQIDDLSNQFNSTESLISEKTQNLASLQEQLNPISEKMNELQSQRAELDTKLNNQLNTIASQVENQEQVSDEAKALKEQFESQIAELDNQLKNYENQSVEINTQLTSITSELNTLEAETPELANQIESLNQDLKNFENIKADLAMATAKKLGLTVNEKAIETVEIIDGKAIVSLKGTDIVKIVDQNMLVDQANSLIDPVVELSKNRKLYTANALNPALITPEFVEASKSIAGIDKLKVLAETTALDVAGATTEQAAKMASAKAARLAARKDWDEAMASGDKAAEAAAQAAWVAAKDAEQVAGLEVAQAAASASVAVESVTSSVANAAQEAAQNVAEVAQEAAADVQETIEATQDAQQAALDALWELESLPGATGTHTFEVTAAIRQLQAEMNGLEYNYAGASSYEEAMENIKSGVNPGDHPDPNRMGPCGKPSC